MISWRSIFRFRLIQFSITISYVSGWLIHRQWLYLYIGSNFQLNKYFQMSAYYIFHWIHIVYASCTLSFCQRCDSDLDWTHTDKWYICYLFETNLIFPFIIDKLTRWTLSGLNLSKYVHWIHILYIQHWTLNKWQI